MTNYDREIFETETRLLNELGKMKFSMKKLRKAIELNALVSYYNK